VPDTASVRARAVKTPPRSAPGLVAVPDTAEAAAGSRGRMAYGMSLGRKGRTVETAMRMMMTISRTSKRRLAALLASFS
jgi:hypothetical protein